MSRSLNRHSWQVASLALLGILFAVGMVVVATADDPPSTAEPTAHARRLDQMRARAKRATVKLIADGAVARLNDKDAVTFEENPVFRYSDQPRDFCDGTLWMWTSQGRPIALCKIEDWREKQKGPLWVTCFSSLSTGLIDSKWQNGPAWAATKPGLRFRTVSDFERPATTDAGRLRQFKQLSERFSINLERDYDGPDRQEMRRLPRALHRYHVPETHVADAVLFAWTTNGTNPDAVVVFELQSTEDKHEWTYALAAVTADKVVLKLDGAVVDSKDHTPQTGGATIKYFFERNLSPID